MNYSPRLFSGIFGSLACMIFLTGVHGMHGEVLNSTCIHYKVNAGYTVNTALKVSQARSVIECASMCSNLGGVNDSCRSSTFDSGTDTCILSLDEEWDLVNLGNPNYSTAFLPQNQPDPETALTSSYSGTEFYLAFLDNVQFFYPASCLLYFVATTSTNVTVSIPYLSINETFLLTDAAVRNYSADLLQSADGASNKGIYVHSDRPISLYMNNKVNHTMDMSVVLPLSGLGKTYIVQTNQNTDTSFTVVGTKDGTYVNIQSDFMATSFILDRLETVLVVDSSLRPVLGSEVSADAEVVVIAGAMCTTIPRGIPACDHVSEILPPEESFGKVFVASFMYPRPEFTIGIVAKAPGTYINITDETGVMLETLAMDRSDVIHRTYLRNSTVLISASAGIQVAQYGHGYSTQDVSIPFGDPSMMVIPPIEKYDRVYEILIPEYEINLIGVVVDDESRIRFNDTAPNFAHALSVKVPANGTLRVGYAEVLPGKVRITHVADAQFAVFVYGGHGRGEYAFSAGWMK